MMMRAALPVPAVISDEADARSLEGRGEWLANVVRLGGCNCMTTSEKRSDKASGDSLPNSLVSMLYPTTAACSESTGLLTRLAKRRTDPNREAR